MDNDVESQVWTRPVGELPTLKTFLHTAIAAITGKYIAKCDAKCVANASQNASQNALGFYNAKFISAAKTPKSREKSRKPFYLFPLNSNWVRDGGGLKITNSIR